LPGLLLRVTVLATKVNPSREGRNRWNQYPSPKNPRDPEAAHIGP
jgi:hypothetical protein